MTFLFKRQNYRGLLFLLYALLFMQPLFAQKKQLRVADNENNKTYTFSFEEADKAARKWFEIYRRGAETEDVQLSYTRYEMDAAATSIKVIYEKTSINRAGSGGAEKPEHKREPADVQTDIQIVDIELPEEQIVPAAATASNGAAATTATASTAKDETIIVKRGNKIIGRFTRGKQLEIVDNKVLYGGNTIVLNPDKTTTVTGVLKAVNTVGERGINDNKTYNGATAADAVNKGGINILRSPQWNKIQETFTATITKVTRNQPTNTNPTRPVTTDTSRTELKDWDEIPGEFWEKVNKPWLDRAIRRNDRFRFVSDPHDNAAIYRLDVNGKPLMGADHKLLRTIFGKEVEYLQSQGYRILNDGTAVR